MEPKVRKERTKGENANANAAFKKIEDCPTVGDYVCIYRISHIQIITTI